MRLIAILLILVVLLSGCESPETVQCKMHFESTDYFARVDNATHIMCCKWLRGWHEDCHTIVKIDTT